MLFACRECMQNDRLVDAVADFLREVQEVLGVDEAMWVVCSVLKNLIDPRPCLI